VDVLIGFAIFLPFLTVVIAIHELGHLYFARRFGMKIEQYFIGMGPRIWSIRRGETEYGIKAFPIGGYVRIAGMNPFETVLPEDLPRTYGAKPAWQRALVIFAGPGSHFLIAAVLFVTFFAIYGKPAGLLGVGELAGFGGHGSPARAAGLLPDDLIARVCDVESPDDEDLRRCNTANVGRPVTYVVLRDGERLTFEVTPQWDTLDGERYGRVGVLIEEGRLPVDPLEAATFGVREVGGSVAASVDMAGQVFGPEGIGKVFGPLLGEEPRDPSGPTSVIGISQAVGQASEEGGGWLRILYSFGFATVFIGLINLVPLPPFDGGHLMLLGLEKLRGGRPVDVRKVVPVSVAVISLLVVFVGATMILDITEPISLSP
jgi:membrane-associated protease RseP (regulator of RpoE activity)